MARETLVDFFRDFADGQEDFLVYDDGYRTRTHRYQEVGAAAAAFGARLQAAGLAKGDAVLFWSENRPEWIAAFWGCLLAGVVAVPIDYRASPSFAREVARIVRARLVLLGTEVAPVAAAALRSELADTSFWPLPEVSWADRRTPSAVPHFKDDVAEIIFTSGATAAPKGVVITHRNLLANIVPVEREVLKYRRWGRPFFPLRFLDLLPLSHLFGQAMATFIPPMLRGTVVFMHGYNPAEIVRQVKRRRVSVLVCVPKILDVLREHVVLNEGGVENRAEEPAERAVSPAGRSRTGLAARVARRWWRHRRVHRDFGFKFWSFVVGAAPLDPSLEEFWSRLGFLVIQGYGLTETAPIVSLNHPFAARRGSVGKPIAGTEVRIAEDGEILVRGENVTSGYYGDEPHDTEAFEGGWLHTGDVGGLDADGRLFVRGRKKEMIVTPEGLNVFPEDVERVLDSLPGVRESAVVGVRRHGEERVHAVLVTDEGVSADSVVREANAQLTEPQRLRGASIWPRPQLPRTEGTSKLKRGEIRHWVESGEAPAAPAGGEGLEAILARFAGGRAVGRETTLEELGLTSLDRVELAVALEGRYGARLDEGRLGEARTVGEVEEMLRAPDAGRVEAEWVMPAWNRRLPARWVRNASLATWVLPATRAFAWLHVEGLEHLSGLEGPVVFAANHQSHLDTPALYAALPPRWRYRVAVAMAKEYFAAHFHPAGHSRAQRLSKRLLYGLAALFFNAFPLPQREAGARRTLGYIGELLDEGWSVLIYPEGRRTETGAVGHFRPGVGMVGSRLAVPIVPVRLEGLDRVLHRSWRMARRGRVRVAFGAPIVAADEDYQALAAAVEEAVRRLGRREDQ